MAQLLCCNTQRVHFLRYLLLDLLQLGMDGGRVRPCGLRRILHGGWSLSWNWWTATKSKPETNLPRTRWIGIRGRWQWSIALVNLLMKIVEQITTNGAKANSERTELKYSGSWRFSLSTWLTGHLISTKAIGLSGTSNISRQIVHIGSGSLETLGCDHWTPTSGTVLLSFEPAAKACKMEDMPTRELLRTQTIRDPCGRWWLWTSLSVSTYRGLS
jgi:hypothetical protein